MGLRPEISTLAPGLTISEGLSRYGVIADEVIKWEGQGGSSGCRQIFIRRGVEEQFKVGISSTSDIVDEMISRLLNLIYLDAV